MVIYLSHANYNICITFFLFNAIISVIHCQSTTNCISNECQSQDIHSSQITCMGEYSCQSCSLTSTDGSNGFIKCPGSSSCSDTTKIYASNYVYCSGAYSCLSSSNINAQDIYCGGTSGCSLSNIKSNKNIYCDALHSCSNAKLDTANILSCAASESCQNADIDGGKAIDCDGNRACYEASMYGNKIGCMGTQSCRSASIRGNSVRGYAFESFYGSTIKGSKSVRAWGYESLLHTTIDSSGISKMTVEIYADSYDTKIICRSSSKCIVACEGNGCEGIIFYCQSGANCIILPSGCKTDNSVSDVDGVTCPVFSDILPTSITADDDGHDIDFDEDPIIDPDTNSPMSCDAEESCTKMVDDSGLNARCNGEKSCMKSTFKETGVACDGSMSCTQNVFKNNAFHNTYCNGYQSCYRARGSVGEIGIPGFHPFECAGSESCAKAKLDVGDIKCQGAYSCSKSKLNLVDSDSITIGGWQAASKSTITGSIKFVHLYGYAAIYLGTIDVTGDVSGEVIVNSYGYLSGLLGTFICRTGKVCTLNCKGSGCMAMTYVCEKGASCTVDPVECAGTHKYNGIYCPTRKTIGNADEYEKSQYVLNKDIYDKFDEYLENVMENDGIEFDEYEIADILRLNDKWTIFAQDKVVNNSFGYNFDSNNAFRWVLCTYLIMGCIIFLWYILKKKYRNKEDEYVAIN